VLGGGDAADEIAGDLHEEFAREAARRGNGAARTWYVVQASRLAARALIDRVGRGRPAAILEPSASRRGDPFMRTLMTDVTHAMRMMIKRPALTGLVVLTLALGMGANATIFETIDALVLRPFDFPNLDRIVMIAETEPGSTYGGAQEAVSPANFLDWKKEAKTVDQIAGFEWWDVNLAGNNDAERVQGAFVSASFFTIMGVQPALGRAFTTDEETQGRHRLAILSDGLWRRRFGGDPAIVGRTLLLDAEPYEVVGVMPHGFVFPNGADVWAPLSFSAKTAANRTARYISVVATLAPGRSLDDAKVEMAVIAGRLEKQYPEANRSHGAKVVTLLAGMRDEGLGPILSLWQASAALILLIACANIANLLLARGAERQREIAVRVALGASRSRVVRGLLTESLALAVASVPAAIAVAWIGITLIRANLPPRLLQFVPGWQDMDVDLRLIAFTALLGAAASVIFGLMPALQTSRPQLGETLKDGGRSTTAAPRRQRLQRALVVAEVALTLPLLVASSLAAIGTQRFLSGSQGYDPDGLLTMRAVLPDTKYAEPQHRRQFVEELLAGVATLPGVERAAVSNAMPSISGSASRPIEIEGQPAADPANPPTVDYRAVTSGYFDTMRIPIVAGRRFDDTDRSDTMQVVIVSEATVNRFFPGRDPIGKRLRFGSGEWQTVVGVSGDVIQDWFSRRNQPTVYRPYVQAPTGNLAIALRAPSGLATLGAAATSVVRRIDPAQPVFDVRTMRVVLHEKTIGLQYVAVIMAVFAGLALVLAVVGVYSVMAFMVTQRTHEIGVRIALGASRGDVLRLAVAQAARMTAIGVVLGFALSLALGRLMEAGLLGIVSSDARISVLFAMVLIASALLAGYLPARRATGIDPMIAMRAE
jgi:putative ABC transport system permease protein